jgi:hypothetical protein
MKERGGEKEREKEKRERRGRRGEGGEVEAAVVELASENRDRWFILFSN